MYVYSGKFDYSDPNGALVAQDACKLSFDDETCTITPVGGVPLAFDLGDVDSLETGDWDLQLELFTGRRLHLRQFGKVFSQMCAQLLASWRDRTVRCLLLEDMEQVDRFDGAAGGSPAEIRLYRTNLGVLPMGGSPFQWRLADVDSIWFDDSSYSVVLGRDGERLEISKLAKRTEEFAGKLQGVHGELREQSARALNDLFPFLGPDRLQRLLTVMPEGRSASLRNLAGIHPKLPEALVARAVDARLKPYCDALQSRAEADSLFAGFKFIRENEQPEEDGEAEPEEAAEAPAEGEQDKPPLFFWFFIPVARDVVAWEASTGSGRATYFFRVEGDLDRAVAQLTRGLALVNFRREPVYLSDDSLERQPKFRRYLIGSRKLPELRALRAAMMGRAIHSTLDKWSAQVNGIVRRA